MLLGGIAVVAQNAGREAAVVSSNADAAPQLLALEDQRGEDLLDVGALLLELTGHMAAHGIRGAQPKHP
jgi:hypothetical protein